MKEVNMLIYLLLTAAVILLSLILGRVSSRLGLPTLLVFIFLGMMFGSDGLFKIPFDNYGTAEQICSVSLIFIMFYGGFGTNWRKGRPVAVRAIMLSGLGTVMTAFITAAFCRLVLGFGNLESLLTGSVISSTDAASVFSVLRSKRLNLKYNTASLLELESGSNDPFSNILTVIALSAMSGKSSGGSVAYMVFAQLIYGVLFGIGIAAAVGFVLKKVNFRSGGFDSIFVFCAALVSYALPSIVGGNGYLSTYITGIILGNIAIENKKTLVHFFDGITGLTEILLFFLLGLLSFPSQLPNVIIPGLAIALFLTFAARPLSVFAVMTPFGCPSGQRLLVSWAGLRGAASIAFAIMATVSPAYMKNDVFHIVFFIVLFSISVQGTLLPFVARRLNMIDDREDVMKTFSDYSEEVPVQFIKLHISEGHPWSGMKVRDIQLLPEVILVLIARNGKQLVPKGSTAVMTGDTVILSGPSLGGGKDYFGNLTEITVDHDHEWLGRQLSQIKFGNDRLVVLIKRHRRIVMPSGKTVIREGDILIINQTV